LSPDFTFLLFTGVLFGVAVVVFIAWRFSAADALAFVLIAGLFPAVMDFLSSFAVQNYVYPGQSRLWVFSYIFFGWMGVCGTCMLIAEGILARPNEDLLTQHALWWQAPLATGVIAVLLDLFLDPIAVLAGYWLWLVQSSVHYGIPMLNFVGWFVLTSLAPLAWILIARRQRWGFAWKTAAAILAIIPLCIASSLLSLLLNAAIATLGLR
jgi:putative membrane protein